MGSLRRQRHDSRSSGTNMIQKRKNPGLPPGAAWFHGDMRTGDPDGSGEAAPVRAPSRAWAEPFVLETERTRLRPSAASDAARLFPHIHRQSSVTDWICWDGPDSPVDLIDRYVSWRLHTPEEPVYVFIIERTGDGAVIGEGTLRFDGHPGVGDLGYWLGEAFHGAGHGRDTVELLTRAGFERCGARSLTAHVKVGNDRSLHILGLMGFQLEEQESPSGSADLPPAQRPIGWIASQTRVAWEGQAGPM